METNPLQKIFKLILHTEPITTEIAQQLNDVQWIQVAPFHVVAVRAKQRKHHRTLARLHIITSVHIITVFSSLFVCVSVSNFVQKLQMDLHEIFREDWQWTNKQMTKFQWRSVSPSGYRDCFPDSSLLGDMESG